MSRVSIFATVREVLNLDIIPAVHLLYLLSLSSLLPSALNISHDVGIDGCSYIGYHGRASAKALPGEFSLYVIRAVLTKFSVRYLHPANQ